MTPYSSGTGRPIRWFVTLAGVTGAVAMILSATIVNVAVPSVMGAFGIGQDRAQWIATAFIATMVASQLLSAWLANSLGEKTRFPYHQRDLPGRDGDHDLGHQS